MSYLTIIEATKVHFPIIKELAYKIWPVSYKGVVSDEQIMHMLAERYSEQGFEKALKEGMVFLLIQKDNIPVAFAAYTIQGQKLKLNQIYVDHNLQGSGIGSVIMDHIIEIAGSRELVAIFLTVNRNNKAVKFYEHAGFKIIEEKDFDIGNGYFMNDYIMEKSLT